MDKEQFIRSAIPRMAEYTFPFLTSVIAVEDAHSGYHAGSGLRCMVKGRRAVITSRHVIETALSAKGGVALSAGYAQHPFQVAGRVLTDVAGDLAIYLLPDNFSIDREDVKFWPEDRLQFSFEKVATDYLFTHGFPAARSRFLWAVQGVASKSLPYGAMQRLESLPSDLQPFEFALDFDPSMMFSDATNSAFVDPRGLSGSPVWRIGVSGRSAAEWQPQLSLVVGFLTTWRPNERILVASQAARIREIAF
jgi:hypothetical protein